MTAKKVDTQTPKGTVSKGKVLKAAPAKPAAKTSKVLPAVKKDPVSSEIAELLAAGVRVQVAGTDQVETVEPVLSTTCHTGGEHIPDEPFSQEDSPSESLDASHKDVFLISKVLCMSCVHLCPETGKESPTNCHYDAGNEDCPARTTVIQLGMSRKEIEKAATAIVDATFTGDFERLNLASNRLARKSESVRASVSARVLELQALRTK